MSALLPSRWSSGLLRALALSAALGAAGMAHADRQEDGHDHDRARAALRQGQVLPLRSVLDRVEREQRGQVLKIEFDEDDGRFFYKIRLLQADGRIAKLKADAVTGQVLSIKRKGD